VQVALERCCHAVSVLCVYGCAAADNRSIIRWIKHVATCVSARWPSSPNRKEGRARTQRLFFSGSSTIWSVLTSAEVISNVTSSPSTAALSGKERANCVCNVFQAARCPHHPLIAALSVQHTFSVSRNPARGIRRHRALKWRVCNV
jgi:hypothetical protein